jgi:hypothetical protein
MQPKRTALTLEQRIEVIRKSEKEKLSNRKIAEQMVVGRTQIDNVKTILWHFLNDFNHPFDALNDSTFRSDANFKALSWIKGPETLILREVAS